MQRVPHFAHIAVGLGSPIEWRFRAVVRRMSPPCHPHDPGSGLGGFDLALLQLTAYAVDEAKAAVQPNHAQCWQGLPRASVAATE